MNAGAMIRIQGQKSIHQPLMKMVNHNIVGETKNSAPQNEQVTQLEPTYPSPYSPALGSSRRGQIFPFEESPLFEENRTQNATAKTRLVMSHQCGPRKEGNDFTIDLLRQ
ncbi:ATV_HP_G0159050.mRNA.1.CDS.1 [Saccharomyces cerevisiae]|nr:ATV_HP_G0159050.mRNA.1.CDS.1 [Saccharomyces cerevisiae]CAI6938388.1 ATV_HP_G0159050.mRNA.1.CDS.1 [Saccharomyces cerevisiae]